MQQGGWQRVAPMGDAQREQQQKQCRRQGETGPGGKGAEVTAALQADGEADLAAGRAGQELAEGDQIGIAALVEPLAATDELLAKVAKVRHRAAEGSQTQTQENQEDAPGACGWGARG